MKNILILFFLLIGLLTQKNIGDIFDCGVNYQRYFKEENKQQKFLDELYNELKKVNFK